MLIILIFCLISSVLGQFIPTRCCVDKQYEATLGELGGVWYYYHGKHTYYLLNGVSYLHFDHYRKVSVTEGHLQNRDGTVQKSLIYIDFKTEKEYNLANGICTVQNTFIPYKGPCIPDGAVFLGSSFMGYGPSEIPIDTWQYVMPQSDHTVKVSVTREGCIPVVDSIYGHYTLANGETNSLEMTLLITNFKPGISKPDIFNFPPECVNATHLPSDVQTT